jgi:hypothetical protein
MMAILNALGPGLRAATKEAAGVRSLGGFYIP